MIGAAAAYRPGARRPAGRTGRPMTAPAPHTNARRLPTRATALMIGAAAVVAIGVTAWLATSPGAETAQTGMVRWFNDPPRPASWVLALTNPLLRPVPLVLVSAVLLGCALTAGSRSSRLEIAARRRHRGTDCRGGRADPQACR